MSKKRTENIVANDLNSRYLSIIEEKNDASYFLKIAEYGNYLLSTDKVDYVYKDIEKEHKSQLKNYEKDLRKFVKAFKKEGDVVVNAVERASKKGIIKTSPEELETLKEKVGGTDLNHYWNDVSFLWNDYVWVMRYLQDRKESNKKVAEVYNKLTNKNGEWKLWSDHVKAEGAWQDFKNKREISTWWAHFKVLMLAAGVYDPNTRQKYLTVGEELDDLYDWEFKQIQQGQTSNLILIHRHKYREYLRKLHYYLIGRLNSTVPILYMYNNGKLFEQSEVSLNTPTTVKKEDNKEGIVDKSGLFYDTINEWVFRKSKDVKIVVTMQSNEGEFLRELIKKEYVSKKYMLEKAENKKKNGLGVYDYRKNLRLKLLKENFLSKKEFESLVPSTKKGAPYYMNTNYCLD